jgi:hypothetical protein
MEKKCCICAREFTEFGNNPEPFEGDTCCDDCNNRWVVPIRTLRGRSIKDKRLLALMVDMCRFANFFVSSKEMISAQRKKRKEIA